MNLSGRVIRVDHTRLVCGGSWMQLEKFLTANRFLKGRIFILTDQNTRQYCLPVLISHLQALKSAVILEISAGENSKTLQHASSLWQQLSDGQADRKTLLINLGGGVVTDLGGFIAAGYMRGIPYINIPTSLMGQVDAAIGGKTAINLQGIKNQIGFFYSPQAVFVFTEFLHSLSPEHLKSGFSEILKTALVGDPSFYRGITRLSILQWQQLHPTDKKWKEIIQKTMVIKNRMVRNDFLEKNQRKILNFGHTFGHAFETLSYQHREIPLLHGEAVARGMIAASFLSSIKTGLKEADRDMIINYIMEGFSIRKPGIEDFSLLRELMLHDKKNMDGRIRFTLLKQPGSAIINVPCAEEDVFQAYQLYMNRLS